MEIKKQRMNEIDVARGIAMLLVMWGHFVTNDLLVKPVYIFHVPLFFIISGYLFDGQKYTVRIFLKKKIRTMIIPYFLLGIPIVISQLIINKQYTVHALVYYCTKYFVQKRETTMWFLACLLLVEVFYYVIIKCFDKKNGEYIVLAVSYICAMFGAICLRYINIALPWNLDLALYSVGFFSNGWIYRKKIQLLVSKIKRKYMFIFFLSGICMGLILYKKSGGIYDMFYGEIGIPIISFIIATICSISLIELCKYIKNITLLKYIGKNTLLFFAWHQMIFKQFFIRCLGLHGVLFMIISLIITIGITIVLNELMLNSKLCIALGKEQVER